MIRLGISVEGSTEREFVSLVLRPHLQDHGLMTTAVDLRGNISLDKIRGVLPALFGQFDRVSTLYDFYGFKGRDGRTADELESAMLQLADQEKRQRFLPYIQQYEFEALLFAVPVQAVEWLGGSPQALLTMQDAVRRAGAPELVDDSPASSPSHRMRTLFASYDKKLHGPEIIELAGLATIRAQCPRFHAWLVRLEQWR